MANIFFLGDVGIDLLTSTSQVGGWATTSAYYTKLLGHNVSLASSVGRDQAGERVITELQQLDFDTNLIQLDDQIATQAVRVREQAEAAPIFELENKAACGFIVKRQGLVETAMQTHLFYFNARGLRWSGTRDSIEGVLEVTPRAIKLFDTRGIANLNDRAKAKIFLDRSNVTVASLRDIPHLCQLLDLPELEPELFCSSIVERLGISTCLVLHPYDGIYGASKNSPLIRISPQLPDNPSLIGWHEAVIAGYIHASIAGGDLETSCSFGSIYASFLSSRHGTLSAWSPKDIQRFNT
jgi:sugar/nucleoside kinase (ribokinase family)